MPRILRASVMAAALVGGALVAANAATHEAPRQDSSGIVTRGGPVRLGPAFYAHQNEKHAVLGLQSMSLAKGCDLVLSMDALPGERVMSLVVDEDETMTKLGIRAGGSGGLEKVTIWMYDAKGKHVCATDKRFGKNANVWIQLTSVAPQV